MCTKSKRSESAKTYSKRHSCSAAVQTRCLWRFGLKYRSFLETEHELRALRCIYIMQRSVQDGSLALEVDGYRTAFLRSISEFNDFAGVSRYQISEDSALELYGFKVGFCFEDL